MKHTLKRSKRIFSYLRLASLLFALSILYCNLLAVTVSDVNRQGGYQKDGSYKWLYSCKVKTQSQKAEQLSLSLSSPSDFPFRIEGLASTVTVDSLSPRAIEFSVIVPANCIYEPIDTKNYNLLFSVIKGEVIVANKNIAASGPLPQHPRLFVRKDELEALKRRFNHSDFYDLKKIFNEQKNYDTNGKVTSDRPDENIRQKMEALALEYMLNPESKKSSGKQAVSLALNYLSSYSTQRTTKAVGYEDNTNTYEAILGAALVYDWCYSLLSQNDKAELLELMKKVCLLGEYGLPNTSKVQYFAGHYGECAPTVYMAIGIATFDEDPTFFDFEYNEQIKKFAPSRNPMYKAGTHHQGAQYIHVRYTNELLQHFMLNKLGISPYDKEISKAVFRAVYDIIPQKKDMDGIPEGDGHNHLEMGYSELFYLAANLSKDPVLQTVSKDNLMATKHQSARVFIYHNPEIPSNPMDSLCLSRFFPSPSGIMIARTKWDMDKTDYTSDAMVVIMNMKEYNAQNHTHLDGGHFGIYYKGHLALDAGIYQGKDAQNGWAKLNYTNYFARTVAHNSLLILDPNEPLPYGWDKKAVVKARDGGQFFFADHAWDTSEDMFKAGKSSEILAEEISAGVEPDYSYFKGDLTKAYNVPHFVADYPAKVETVRRSFVFLNHKSKDIPGTLIVLDKVVSTNASFKKTWLLHTQNEPIINKNTIIATNTNNGRNGKLMTTVLLPEISNQNIQKIGGEGKEYWSDGSNWGSVTQEDAGRWRIELSPLKSAVSDNFLNVIQAMDASYNADGQKIEKVVSENGEYVAVQIKDRIVAEKLALDKNTNELKFSLGNKNTAYKVLITDLQSGKWSVSSPAGVKTMTVSETAGTLYFDSNGGTFMIKKI